MVEFFVCVSLSVTAVAYPADKGVCHWDRTNLAADFTNDLSCQNVTVMDYLARSNSARLKRWT